MTMKKQPDKVEMMVAGGEKILVPASEDIILPNGVKRTITKVNPLGKLIKSVYCEASFLILYDKRKKPRVRISNMRLRLKLAETYAGALPVTSEHRRCVYCGRPPCCRLVYAQESDFRDEEILKANNMFMYGSLCLDHGWQFVTLRKIKTTPKKGTPTNQICWVCKSPREDKNLLIEESSVPDRKTVFVNLPLGKDLWKCSNCGSFLDSSEELISLPTKTDITEIREFRRGKWCLKESGESLTRIGVFNQPVHIRKEKIL